MKILDTRDKSLQFNIALVISRFNEEVTQRLCDGAVARLQELEFSEDQITVAWVPGAVEIPIVAQRFARTGAYEAIVCLGAVIRGETSHFDYVCKQVSDGCQQVALKYDVPVIFGLLTTEDEDQALARAGGEMGHKGRISIDDAVEMAALMRQLD